MPDRTLRHAPPDRTEAHAPGPSSLADRTTEPGPAAAPPPGLPAVPGYEVVGEIARGGMGRVLAARELALDREAAIKVLLPGAPAGRFVTESKITARLPHPNIPPVYALGELADGSPFLAMKLVRGRTLAEELRARAEPADTLPQLVQVFEAVCQAVGFAHSRGVIHRDLKPANVMVGEFGEVQVMDWGLAKVLTAGDDEAGPGDDAFWQAVEAEGQGAEDRTRAGAIMGTPAYMAPEQARGEPVGERADVFALGGILTAILTGKPAFAGRSALGTLAQAAEGDTADALARLGRCRADPELVAVATACLAVDPAARPADGRAVAGQVAAYRAGVEGRLRQADTDRAAAAATAVEEAKRRRAVRGWAVAVAAVLLAGIGASGWQAWRAWRAEGVAVVEADNARLARDEAVERQKQEVIATTRAVKEGKAATAAKNFMSDMLVQASADGQATAERQANPDLTMREALDNAAREVAGRFADQPDIAADLHHVIGLAYLGLDRPAEARTHLSRTVELSRATHGPDHSETLQACSDLASAHLKEGNYAVAEPLYRQTLAGYRATAGSTDPRTLRTLGNLGVLLLERGDHAAARACVEEELNGLEQTVGPNDRTTLGCVINLANINLRAGDPTAAGRLSERAVRGCETAYGPAHPLTLTALSGLGMARMDAGDLTAAESLLKRALGGRERVLGPGHPDALRSAAMLGKLYLTRRDTAAAVPLIDRALRGYETALGPSHPATLASVNDLALAHVQAGRVAAAEPLLRRAALAIERTGFRSPDNERTVANYVICLGRLDRLPEAEGWQRKVAAAVAARAGADSPKLAEELFQLGNYQLELRMWVEAEGTFRQCLAIHERQPDAAPGSPLTRRRANSRGGVGAALLGQRRYADAEPLLLASYSQLVVIANTLPPAGRILLPKAADRLAALYARWGKPDEAANWRVERSKYPPEVAPRPRPAK